MKIDEYVIQKKKLYDRLLNFIENEDKDSFQNITNLVDEQKLKENREELQEFLLIIVKISENHNRINDFYKKIIQILNFYANAIKENFSNSEIFEFFQNNKLMLLYLFKNNIITVDETIVNSIYEKDKMNYNLYFYTEIKSFIDNQKRKSIENELKKTDNEIMNNFEELRLNGENDSYMCQLIRKDSVEEFISYVNQKNYSLSSIINDSIFETNLFLIENKPSIIEYAAFFGSIQIFQFLRMSNAELNPSLWLYAIHGRNAEIIHLLEEDEIKPKDPFFEECLEEAIKCHHNDIADYIQNNLLYEKVEKNNIEQNYEKNLICYSFRYHNYKFMPTEFDNQFIFHYLCESLQLASENGNIEIIQILLKQPGIEIRERSFINCTKLKVIEIPSHVTSIGSYSFLDCTSLSKITLPQSLKSIGRCAFSGCNSLIEIEIPPLVTKINSKTFYGCSSLEKVSFPSSLTIIEGNSFSGCISLKKIELPQSIVKIESNAFYNCILIESISIPPSVTEIYDGAFNGCKALKLIDLSVSIRSIESYLFQDCKSLVKIEIPRFVTSIMANAFGKCESLSEIVFPPSLKIIESCAFIDCISLNKVSFPSSLSSIGDYAFMNCSSLKQVEILSPDVKIGVCVFSGCSSLKKILNPFNVHIDLGNINIDMNGKKVNESKCIIH